MYIPGLVVVVRHPQGESLPLLRLGLSVGTLPGREVMEPGSLGSKVGTSTVPHSPVTRAVPCLPRDRILGKPNNAHKSGRSLLGVTCIALFIGCRSWHVGHIIVRVGGDATRTCPNTRS